MTKKIDLSSFDEEVSKNQELDLSGFDDEVSGDDEVSKLESAWRGGVQGGTVDFADEILGGITAAVDVATGEPTIKDLPQLYKKYRDIEREKFKKAEEANPSTYMAADIASGVVPALFSGGAAAAANLGKVAAKQSVKELAKTGAKYGAAAALGRTENITDIPEVAKDVATGAGLGAATGVALPAVAKGAGKGLGQLKKGAEALAEKFPTITKPFEFAAKYGMTSTKKRGEILEKDIKELLDSFQAKFQKLGLDKKTAEEKAAQLNAEFDLTGDLQSISNRVKEEAKYLLGKDKIEAEKLAQEIEDLFNIEQRLTKELEEELQSEINTKLQKSQNKDVASQKKAEGKAVMEAEKKDLSLEQIENMNKSYDQVSEMPYETVGGRIKGGKAKFKEMVIDPETGEEVAEYTQKKFLEDVTPFQPSKINISKEDGKLVGSYLNEATGEVYKRYKDIPVQDINFKKMSIDDMLSFLAAAQKKAFEEGGAAAARYKELWKLGRNTVPKMIENLSENKQEYAKMYAILDILGIDKDIMQKGSQYMSQDMVELMKKLPNKMGTEKDYIERNLLKDSDPISKKMKDIDLISEVNRITEGSHSPSGEFTKAGVSQKATGLASEVAGALYGKAVKPLVNKSGKAIQSLNKMSDESLAKISNKFSNSNNAVLQGIGGNIKKAMEAEGPLKNALLWSLSQQPAIRKSIEEMYEEEETSSFENDIDSSPIPPNEKSDKFITTDLDSEEQEKTPDFKNKAIELIKKLENNQSFKNSGFDKKTNRWKPHKSIEGGEDTLAYGTKLFKGRIPEDRLSQIYKEGISEEEATGLVKEDVDKKYNELSKIAKADLSEFMNDNQIASLISYWYNTGHVEHKLLKRALENKDVKGIFNNMDVVKVNGVPNPGLIQRRQQEKKLFNTPIENIKSNLNKIMKMKSSGMETPEYEIERAFQGINEMNIPEEQKVALQNEVVQIESFSDVERIKSLLDKIAKTS
jgi:GH24 family phage-related lysozyme (muramidase)